MNKWILLLVLILPLQINAQRVAWTGMKTEKLLAISEQGYKGFQYAMTYILGVVDGLEGQRVISEKPPCRVGRDQSNQQIAVTVLSKAKELRKLEEPAGKVVINAYLTSYCLDSTNE
ncbi:hypothetical protein L4D08_23685 [Photobacterium chitinilyticum]|uniref:hypothetical protein n=1 Tax=Photobacterium chitinilyticum TaxID=2485123 RepID=UPI003D1094C5